MDVEDLIIIGIVGGGLYFAFKKRSSLLGQASFDITGAGVRFENITNTKINISARINNPSPVRVTMISLTADVYYNQTLLGTINVLAPTVVAPNATTNVSVPVLINNLSFLTSLPELIRSSNQGISLTVKGKANFDFGSITIDKTIVAKDPYAGQTNATQ